MIGNLGFAFFYLFFASIALFNFGPNEILIISWIGFRSGVVDVDDDRGHVVQKTVVVGDHQGCASELIEETLEPADGENVEMVRRFVEEQYIGL